MANQTKQSKLLRAFTEQYLRGMSKDHRAAAVTLLELCSVPADQSPEITRSGLNAFVESFAEFNRVTRWTFNETLTMCILYVRGEIERLNLPCEWESTAIDITNSLYSAGYDWSTFVSAQHYTVTAEFDTYQFDGHYTYVNRRRDVPHVNVTFRAIGASRTYKRRPFKFSVRVRAGNTIGEFGTEVIDRIRVATEHER